MTKLIKFILTRTFILYIAFFFLIWRIMDYNQFLANAVNQTMSRLTPPMDYFSEFVDKEDHYDRFKLMNCVNYHKAVANFFPFQKAEAFGMLGFCYERLGQGSQAIKSYQEAISSNPDYFWPYYDLGVISYRKSEYSQAANYFTQAIEQEPVKTIVLLSRSKVYNDVNLSRLNGPSNYLLNLKEGRVGAYILLMDSLYKNNSYELLWKIAVNGLKEGLDTDGIFYFYAGVASFNLKSYEKAMEFLQIAIQNDRNNADALMYLGLCLKMAGKADMAQLLINKAAQLHDQGSSKLEQYLKPRVRFF